MSELDDAESLLGRALAGTVSWDEVGGPDIESLCTAAEEHGVAALLWTGLAGARGAAASLRTALEPSARAAAARDLIAQRELRGLLDAFADAGIPVLLTKGTALAYSVYPRPWLRPRIDTDLLVRRHDAGAAERVLEGRGYKRSDALSSGELVSHQLAFARTDAHHVRHVIDLHWKVANPQIVADALPFDDLWKDAQPAALLGPSARVPSTVASVALACVHRLAHHQGHERLIWLYDLKLLTAVMDQRDWEALRDLSCERNIASLCLDGLQAARTRLQASVPHDIEVALALAAPEESARAYVDGPVRKRDVLISDMKTLGSWRERFRLAREHAFPPAAFMRHRYSGHSWWPLPALYVHRLVTGASRWIRS